MTPDFWHRRVVLVTGVTGLLGGWLVKTLLLAGAHVAVLLRKQTGTSMAHWEGFLDRCLLFEGEIEDGELLRRILRSCAPQTVFHLAAQTQADEAQRNPVATFEANIRGSWILLDACRVVGTSQVILSSSEKAYGQTSDRAYCETDRLEAKNPYGVSKSCADLIAQMYAATYGLPVVIARCCNIIGGGDLNFRRIVPGLIRDTLHGERFVIRGHGSDVREYLYVEDAVEGYLRMAEALDRSPSLAGEAFNLSTESCITVREMAEQVLRVMGRGDLRPVIHASSSSVAAYQSLSAQKARALLTWSPKFDLQQGLSHTVAWYRGYFQSMEGMSGAASARAVSQ